MSTLAALPVEVPPGPQETGDAGRTCFNEFVRREKTMEDTDNDVEVLEAERFHLIRIDPIYGRSISVTYSDMPDAELRRHHRSIREEMLSRKMVIT